MSIISVENLSLKTGAKYILRDIDWQIDQGDCWLVYGLNGCGKTTLLSVLAGCQRSDSGKVTLYDEVLNQENLFNLRRKIGWASASFFEKYIRYENVLDFVLSGKWGTLGFDEEPTDDDVHKAKHLLRELGLGKNARYPFDCLSCGQRQKALLARAMMAEGEILLLDEPCSGLDILSKAKVLYEMERLAKEGKTIICVTHHIDEILPIFNKALLLKDGQVHSKGKIETIFSDENLSDFLGVPVKVSHMDRTWSLFVDMRGVSLENCGKRRERTS